MALTVVASECLRMLFSLQYLCKGIATLVSYCGFVKEQNYEEVVTHLCANRKAVAAEEILIFIIIKPFC